MGRAPGPVCAAGLVAECAGGGGATDRQVSGGIAASTPACDDGRTLPALLGGGCGSPAGRGRVTFFRATGGPKPQVGHAPFLSDAVSPGRFGRSWRRSAVCRARSG